MTDDDRLVALLEQAGEATRFEGEALWRAIEFFVGITATLLAIAFAVLQVAVPRLLGSAAFFVAAIAGLIAILGQYVLFIQTFYYLRARLVRDRLLTAVATGRAPDLDYEARALTASLAEPQRLRVDDLEAIERDLRSRGGVRWVFRIIFGLMMVFALVLMLDLLPSQASDDAEFFLWSILIILLAGFGASGAFFGFWIPKALRRAADRARSAGSQASQPR